MFSRTTCMIKNEKKSFYQIFWANRFIAAMELFPFLINVSWGICFKASSCQCDHLPFISLARALVAQMLRETNWNFFFRSIDKLVPILDDFPYPLKRFKVFPSLRAVSFYTWLGGPRTQSGYFFLFFSLVIHHFWWKNLPVRFLCSMDFKA